MSTRTGRLLRDSNIGVHMDGGTISAKANFTGQKKLGVGGRKPLGDLSNQKRVGAGGRKPLGDLSNQKRVGAGGRKPLGDLSNSEKLSSQAGGRKTLDGSLNSGKQLKSKKLAIVEEVVPAKVKNLESKNRRALSDISNFEEIKIKGSQKLSTLTEEHPHLSAIAEEQCLHNHQECIKSHSEVMGLRHFFQTVGLESDSDYQLTFSSEVQAFNKLKPESDLKLLDLEEIPEAESPCKKEFSVTQQASPPAHCMTPKISSCYKMWEDCDVNFKLIETPELSKF